MVLRFTLVFLPILLSCLRPTASAQSHQFISLELRKHLNDCILNICIVGIPTCCIIAGVYTVNCFGTILFWDSLLSWIYVCNKLSPLLWIYICFTFILSY